MGNMWTSSQFVDWLGCDDCPFQLSKHAAGPSSPLAGQIAGASGCQTGGSESDQPGCMPSRASPASAAEDCVSSSGNEDMLARASLASEPADTSIKHGHERKQAGSHGPRYTAAHLTWKQVQAKMKQQVLYTLAGAADVIDQRPKSFELYGCGPFHSMATP